jgi:hypothetical protein
VHSFILLMYSDTTSAENVEAWGPYLAGLRRGGHFNGGSSVGAGLTHQKGRKPVPGSNDLVGYILVQAEDLDGAQLFLGGNPTYEAGGTVEIRELLED